MITQLAIAWKHCPSESLLWWQLREPLLQLLYQPWLVLPLICGLSWWLSWALAIQKRIVVIVLLMLLLALIYSPAGTALLSFWLEQQLPPWKSSARLEAPPAVAVLLGRGPQIAMAATAEAAARIRYGGVSAVYVSGDTIHTAHVLQRQGVPADQIAGDTCARTTWENATHTAEWLRRNHPGSPVLLITDPWQLPRATAAFLRQGLDVRPISAEPVLNASGRNRLALRETAGTVLYRLQGRF